MKSMKVIITGANGFLGSWLTRALAADGHDVSILVRETSDLSEIKDVVCKKVIGDVTDQDSLLKAFRGQDTVFHLAGVVAYKSSDRPLMDRVNIGGTQNVINAIKATPGSPQLIDVSSVVAVGAGFNAHMILDETASYNLHSLNLGYFETKHAAEVLVKKACDLGEIQAVILNPSTIYGFGDAKKGSRKTQIKVARGEFPFFTSGGVNVVAVEDVIQGILAAWKKGRNGERYILSGENLLIKDLFALIAEAAHVSAPKYRMPDSILHGLGLLGDQASRFGLKAPVSRENAWTATLFHWFKNDKARAELDFNPRPAREAIANSVQWMREKSYLAPSGGRQK